MGFESKRMRCAKGSPFHFTAYSGKKASESNAHEMYQYEAS